MDASEIRRRFLDHFVRYRHLEVASAPLVAPGDPTLLFTSAGMVPFKPYFLGQAAPPRPRLASIQKCFRTTDIDEVGDDSHLTFFEMLGNFSFGDYFKAEAQAFAWELVTQELAIPADRLVTTIFHDDEEAFKGWRKLGVPASKIYRYGKAEGNYWSAGVDGPCGPCSEIYYDFGPETDRDQDSEPRDETGRYLEIWNLVFMQFLQGADGSETPLPLRTSTPAPVWSAGPWSCKASVTSMRPTSLPLSSPTSLAAAAGNTPRSAPTTSVLCASLPSTDAP